MAITPASFYSTASAPTAKTEVVSAATATKRVIRKATFCNNSGSTLTFDLYIDPTGAQEVQIVDTKTLVDKETWSCPDAEGHVLNAAGTIDIAVSIAGLDVAISGINVT